VTRAKLILQVVFLQCTTAMFKNNVCQESACYSWKLWHRFSYQSLHCTDI